MKNLLIELFKSCAALLAPKKVGQKVDWKSIGQLRARLQTMSNVETRQVFSPVSGGERNMASAFNVLTRRVTDRQGHNRWYGQCLSDNEKELHQKIEAGQRSVLALKQSGQFPVILPEEIDALREVHQRFIAPSLTSESTVASFLSGDSDDINDLLFTNLSVGMVESIEAVKPAPSMRYLDCSPDDTVQDIPVITEEMLASLEHSARIGSLANPHEHEADSDFSASNLEYVEGESMKSLESKVVCLAGAKRAPEAPSESLAADLDSNAGTGFELLSASNVRLFRPRLKNPS